MLIFIIKYVTSKAAAKNHLLFGKQATEAEPKCELLFDKLKLFVEHLSQT